jgi:NADPH-dependent glutamate synthase beta subunit-like oxidoreductase
MATLVQRSTDGLKKGVEKAAAEEAPLKVEPGKRVPHHPRAAEERVKDFEETVSGYTRREAMGESTRCLNCKKPRCKEACPAHVCIPDYMQAVKAGNFDEAFKIIMDQNPMIAACSRVCPHPCEQKCIRGMKTEPLSIQLIKRAADEFSTRPAPACAAKTGKKVAVVGSGPAGLSFAFFMLRAGHAVTIYESKKVAGGMMAICIPSYRLPRENLKLDVERIVAMGAELKTGVTVGKDVTLEQLRKDYDAVFVSIGTLKPRKLNIEGEDEAEGVQHVIPFLEGVNLEGKKPAAGKKVVVVGGGFSALDAARVARRCGCEATILYRRDRASMPAAEEEIVEAIEEGVKLEVLAAPLRIIAKDGKVSGIYCQRTKLGEKDASGRQTPIPVEGEDFEVQADIVIAAISQSAETAGFDGLELDGAGNIKADEKGHTNLPNVYAAGDCVYGPKTIVEAVAAAHAVADEVCSKF